MPNRNENSSLVALRGLREMESRRVREEEQAKADKERWEREQARLRAEQERLARQSAEREAARAREAAEAARLRRELDGAQSEIADLRGQLERARANLAQAQLAVAAPLPPVMAPARSRTFGWLGLTAGATMLVGALALSAAMRPRDGRAVSVTIPARSTPACSGTRSLDPPEPQQTPAASPRIVPSPPPKFTPRPRPSPPGRPRGNGKPPSTNTCDGTDPLCGIDPGVIDDVGKNRRKGDRKTPR
jgi:peptidoglycan DL-endopeptidase CwlO